MLYSQQYPHIPPAHTHNAQSSGNCWSYATARAFDRSNNDSRCAALTIRLNTGAVPDAYFNQTSPFSYADVEAGNIIDFTAGGNQHVAYVRTKTGTSPSQIILDQVENEGGEYFEGLTTNNQWLLRFSSYGRPGFLLGSAANI